MKPVGASAAQELRYAKCMRANGEPNFPDPNSQGAFSFGSAQGIDPNSTQFQAAQSKCGKDLPHPSFSPAQQQQDYARLLKYSQCMRGHGVPSYPDPTRGSGGGVSLSIGGQQRARPQLADLPARAAGVQQAPGRAARPRQGRR